MTSLDSYITLRRSGLRLSPLSLGTMTFGEDNGWGASPATSEANMAEYLDRGGNVIDTANTYTNGHSENIVGDFLAARPGLRDRVLLGTKFFANLHPGDPNGGGAGRKALLSQLEESLRRLQTDYVDLYWLHGWYRRAPRHECHRAISAAHPVDRRSVRPATGDGASDGQLIVLTSPPLVPQPNQRFSACRRGLSSARLPSSEPPSPMPPCPLVHFHRTRPLPRICEGRSNPPLKWRST